jgi:hypothetical protein
MRTLLLIALVCVSLISLNSQVVENVVKVTMNEPLPARDAFSRLRVSNATGLTDHQFTYDLAPLLFDTITVGTGTAISHDKTNRCAKMTMAASPANSEVAMQTFEWFKYQAGKSQLVFITFNLRGAKDSIIKYAGYGNKDNAIRLQLNGTQAQIAILSKTGSGNEVVNQEDWNLDRMDGNGCGIKLDWNKTQILVLDFQALFVGRVRVGFDVDGDIIYAHEFNHANILSDPYIQTATLPIRVGMISSAASTTDTLDLICSSVISEGGSEDISAYQFASSTSVTAGNNTDTHVISIQPDTSIEGIENHEKILLDGFDIIVTGNNPVIYKVVIGQELTSITATDANAAYSGVDVVAGTLSGSPAIVIDQGYIASGASVKGTISRPISFKYPITLGHDGLPRALGRITILAQGIGGISAIQCTLKWREIR